MLKHIPLGFYFEDPYTYREVIGEHTNKLEQYFIRAEKENADCCVKGYIDYEHDGAFDECGMERLVMLIAGMLFCMDNGGISDDDCSLPRKMQKTDKQNTKNKAAKAMPWRLKNGFIAPFQL